MGPIVYQYIYNIHPSICWWYIYIYIHNIPNNTSTSLHIPYIYIYLAIVAWILHCCWYPGIVKCLSGPTTFSTRASLKRFTKRSRCLAPEEAALGIIIDTYTVNTLYIYNMYIHTLICIHISTLYIHDSYVYVYISCIMLARTRWLGHIQRPSSY